MPQSSGHRELVRQRAKCRCEYCGIPEEEFLPATIFQEEHIIPKSLFADCDINKDDLSNLAWSCPRCNQHKSMKCCAHDPDTNNLTSLFNPRTDNWYEHFLAHRSGLIVGLSSIGRATVQALRLNDEGRVRGRLPLYNRGRWPGES